MLKLFFWLRYLRRKKIVLLSVAAVALAVALLIVVSSLFGGFIGAVDRVAPKIFGDIYLDPWVAIPEYQQLLDSLDSLPQIEAATAILPTYGLLHLGQGDVRAVRVFGIDPVGYARVTGFKDALLVQKTLPGRPRFSRGALRKNGGFVSIGILGRPDEETDRYDFEGSTSKWLGKDVVLTTGAVAETGSADAAGVIEKRFRPTHLKFTVTDIVFIGMYFQDTQDIFLPIEQVRDLVGLGRIKNAGANEIVQIKLAENVKPEAAIESVREVWELFAQKHQLPDYAVFNPLLATYRQMEARFVSELHKQLAVLMLIFGIVCSVGVLLIFCIFYMIVITRQKDIAVIKSCGAGSGAVALVFIGFGVCIGFIGSCVGTILGYIITRNINTIEGWVRVVFGFKLWKSSAYMFTEIPNKIDLGAAGWIVLFTICAAAVGALIPAAVAARTRPVEILRYE
jgi:lipoprotein-releasing system permease protein